LARIRAKNVGPPQLCSSAQALLIDGIGMSKHSTIYGQIYADIRSRPNLNQAEVHFNVDSPKSWPIAGIFVVRMEFQVEGGVQSRPATWIAGRSFEERSN